MLNNIKLSPTQSVISIIVETPGICVNFYIKDKGNKELDTFRMLVIADVLLPYCLELGPTLFKMSEHMSKLINNELTKLMMNTNI